MDSMILAIKQGYFLRKSRYTFLMAFYDTLSTLVDILRFHEIGLDIFSHYSPKIYSMKNNVSSLLHVYGYLQLYVQFSSTISTDEWYLVEMCQLRFELYVDVSYFIFFQHVNCNFYTIGHQGVLDRKEPIIRYLLQYY